MTQTQFKAFNEQLSRNYKGLAAHAVDLVKRGRRKHGDLPAGDQAADLLQEALLLLTSGKRTWPAGVELEPVVKMIMLQLAGHRWRSPAAREVSLDRMVEGSLRNNREESESDSDAMDLMREGRIGDLPDSDDDDTATREIPGSTDLYRLTAEELYALKEREDEIRRQMDTVLEDDILGLEVVHSILGGCRTAREIAEELGVTIIKTYQAIRRLKRTLQQFVSEWKTP